jgi:hypothetical protein
MTNRTLPPSTDLDTLRKEAKSLLKSVTQGEREALERVKPYFDDPTSAKLTQMQLVLAREYGFDSWAKLSSHVKDQADLARAQSEVSDIQRRMSGRKSNPEWKSTQVETTHFARQLATMFKVGIPLVESLEIMANDTDNLLMREVILKVRETISASVPLHTAFREHPDYFSDLFCRFTETGESHGALDKTLDLIADYQETLQSGS